jgi:FkbM family methyltransferase
MMRPTKLLSLSVILDSPLTVDVVDVGANPIDGDPPYKRLLENGLARVVGFEPNPHALKALNEARGPRETYLPYAVADGKPHTLRFCLSSGWTSLLEPNPTLNQYFHAFSRWGTVLQEVMVETVRLDDVAEIQTLDHLKIDIQGGELLVFENATRLLSQCAVIQTEVEFLPLYVNQPLFSEVEIFLRSQGFIFHRFWHDARSRALQPMLVDNDVHKGLSQLVDADAVFIRDFTRLDRLPHDTLLRMALIMHDVYHSFDLVLRLLMEIDRRDGGGLASRYIGLLERMSA